MFSHNIVQFSHKPFPFGVIDSFLKDFEKYTFPNLSLFQHLATECSHRHTLYNYHKEKFSNTIHNTPWEDLWNWMNTKDFVNYCKSLFEPYNISIDGTEPGLGFSALPASNGFLVKHNDRPDKCIAMNVYFDGYPIPLNIYDEDTAIPVEWKRNRCVFYTRSEMSYHGVGPANGPENTFRYAIHINLLYK